MTGPGDGAAPGDLPGTGEPGEARRSLRVLTLNLWHGRPARGSGLDAEAASVSPVLARGALDRLAGQIADLDVDVLLLQEVDKAMGRSARIDQAAHLAAALDTPWWRFAAAFGGTGFGGLNPWHWLHLRPGESAVPGGSGYGVAVLSRVPALTWHVAHLPGAGPAIRRTPRPRATIESPRVALAAVLETGAGLVSVASTHLATHPPLASRQLRHLSRSLASLPGPWLLGGDLNLEHDAAAAVLTGTAGGPGAEQREDREPEDAGAARLPGSPVALATAPTFPRGRADTQIDHLLGFGGLIPAAPGGAHRLVVSDHRALLAEAVLA